MHISLINELIHVFALIHDDIVDKGETRHHIPCYHKHLATYYQDDYMGVGQAMLVGDLIYAWTIQELVAIENTQARTIIADMIEKVVA